MSTETMSSDLAFHPIKYHSLWKWRKRQQAVYWLANEVDMKEDRAQWETLEPNLQRFIKHILAFFAQADGLVCENIIENFQQELSHIKEVRFFFSIQNEIEVVHNEMYSIMINTFIVDDDERSKVLDAIHHYPAIKLIENWVRKYMDRALPLPERLIAFACLEGVLFQGVGFAPIRHIKRTYNKLPGLTYSNELIASDENIHTLFYGDLYPILIRDYDFEPVSPSKASSIVTSMITEVAIPFIQDALRADLIGLTQVDLVDYTKTRANSISKMFKYETSYDSENPFPWMIELALENQSNFFEKRVAEYQRVGRPDKLRFDVEF